ncbi:MAG: FHA domain-containing protein [Chthoniobacteraceae bacterium]
MQVSTNGTLLNGSRVEDGALRNGDKVVIGTAIFVCEDTILMATPSHPRILYKKTAPIL